MLYFWYLFCNLYWHTVVYSRLKVSVCLLLLFVVLSGILVDNKVVFYAI